jgi:hypothetical protein
MIQDSDTGTKWWLESDLVYGFEDDHTGLPRRVAYGAGPPA